MQQAPQLCRPGLLTCSMCSICHTKDQQLQSYMRCQLPARPCAAAAAQPSRLLAHRDSSPGQCCCSAVVHGIAAAGPVARACGVNPRLSVQLQAAAPAAISAAATAACPCTAALWRGVSPSASCSRGSAPADNLQPAATAASRHQSRTCRCHTFQHKASRAAGAAHQRHKHCVCQCTHSRFTTSRCPVCAARCRAVARPALVSASTGAPASMPGRLRD